MPPDNRMVLVGDDAGGIPRVGVNLRNITAVVSAPPRPAATKHDVDIYFVRGERLRVTVWHPQGVAGVVDQINDAQKEGTRWERS